MTHQSAQIELIDTHCHLDDPAFDSDREDVIRMSREAGVRRWILIGYAPDRWQSVAGFASRTPGMRHSLGVHPSNAKEWNSSTLETLRSALTSTGAAAIGECGLDFYRDNAPFDVQREAFLPQLTLGTELGLPVIFHMRDAEVEMLELLSNQHALPTMVFHSFDGTDRLTEFVLSHDAYVGVGGLATRQKSDALREQLKRISPDRVLLETDAPYLVPARQKDRRNVPAHVRTIAEWYAEFSGRPLEEIAQITTKNAERVFGRFSS